MIEEKEILIFIREQAHQKGGMRNLSQKTGLGRESLYKSLSKRGNPRLRTLLRIVRALDIEVKLVINLFHT